MRTGMILVLAIAGCGRAERDDWGADSDADVDTDVDSDVDADADTDADSDSDTVSASCDPECPEGWDCVEENGCVPPFDCGGAVPGRCDSGVCQCDETNTCSCIDADSCDGACAPTELCACSGGVCICLPQECGRISGACPPAVPYCICHPGVSCGCELADPCAGSCDPVTQVCVSEEGGTTSCAGRPAYP